VIDRKGALGPRLVEAGKKAAHRVLCAAGEHRVFDDIVSTRALHVHADGCMR